MKVGYGGEKPLEMTYGTAGWFVGSLFGETLGHPQRWPPQFLEDLENGEDLGQDILGDVG